MAYGHTKRDPSPCYTCNERYVRCHSECEKYIKWKKRQDEKNYGLRSQIHPKNCGYFKEKCNNTLAPKSKKRYR